MKIGIIVQARMGATRLPNKVLLPLNGKPVIIYLLERIRHSKLKHEIVVATTDSERDTILAEEIEKNGFNVYRGSENDVLDRYYQAAKKFEIDAIVRVTGDCPLIDPKIIDSVIQKYLDSNDEFTFAANILTETFPDGMDVDIFSFKALEYAWNNAKKTFEREHIRPFFKDNPHLFRPVEVVSQEYLGNYRLTVDEREDYELVNNICEYFGERNDYSLDEIISYLRQNPDVFEINRKFSRDEGLKKSIEDFEKQTGSKSQALWKRAKEIIPGGTCLLSKRSERLLPERWPSYMSRGKGIEVWDLDSKKYFDFSFMGVGPCILGYSDDDVNNAVKKVIELGNMSTLNSPEEVELAELLLKLHPWAEQVRYARTGGEAVSIAVRLARAYTKKDKIAFCGYHGWHDWYLSANLSSDSNLDGHLLKGLNPLGVPRGLLNTTFPFEYNNLEMLKKIVAENDIGVIVMEPIRHKEPKDNFLLEVRKIANEIGAVLVFDEISAGFRMNVGSSHLIYGVNPDIAVIGKAISNGYPMAAVIGKKEIMKLAEFESFISSTYWTERIGPAAAIATINKMISKNVPGHIDAIGRMIGEGWRELAQKHGLKITLEGPNAMINFSIEHSQKEELRTLFTQEMLKRGFLAAQIVYVSYAHKREHVLQYLQAIDEVFPILKKAIDSGDISKFLEVPVAQSGFSRLT